MKDLPQLSVVIPTLARGEFLCATVSQLLTEAPRPCEILVIDQTEKHPSG